MGPPLREVPKIILIDTNVLLDIVLDRAEHVGDAVALFDQLRGDVVTGFVAWHSIATAYYIARREVGEGIARDFIQEVVKVVEVAPVNQDSIHIALDLPLKDFEDSMQAAAALACRAQRIVTRDRNDFDQSPVPSIEPREALELLR